MAVDTTAPGTALVAEAMLVGGAWGGGDDVIPIYDPADTDRVVGTVPRGTAAQPDIHNRRKHQPQRPQSLRRPPDKRRNV